MLFFSFLLVILLVTESDQYHHLNDVNTVKSTALAKMYNLSLVPRWHSIRFETDKNKCVQLSGPLDTKLEDTDLHTDTEEAVSSWSISDLEQMRGTGNWFAFYPHLSPCEFIFCFFSKDFALLFLCANRQKCCKILRGIGKTSEPQRLLHFIRPHISAVCLLVFDCQRISRLEFSGPGGSTGKKKRLELSPLDNTFSRSLQRWSKKECLRQMIFFY